MTTRARWWVGVSALVFCAFARAAIGQQPIPRFDIDKCISSCDTQYTGCIKRGNTNEYCHGQHERCLKGCAEHK